MGWTSIVPTDFGGGGGADGGVLDELLKEVSIVAVGGVAGFGGTIGVGGVIGFSSRG